MSGGTNVPAALTVAAVVANLALLALDAYFLAYMARLRRCECARGWQSRFIAGALLVFALATLLHLCMLLTGALSRRSPSYEMLQTFLFALGVAYVVVARLFIERVRARGGDGNGGCACARGAALQALSVINVLSIAGLALYAALMAALMVAGRAALRTAFAA